MSAAVETMAYSGAVPWHGLGNQVDNDLTLEKMLVAAECDWEIERVPVMAEGKIIKGFFALTRSTDRKVFDIVGSRYKPTQNAQAFEFFREFLDAGEATLETMGSLKGGRYVWGLANLKAGFTLPGKDRVNGYVLVGCPHEQGKSLIIKRTMIRVVCHNTLTAALRDKSGTFSFVHRSKFGPRHITKAKEILGLARDDIRQFERDAKALVEREIKLSKALSIMIPVMSPKATPDNIMDMIKDPEAYTPRIKTLMDCYHKAPGATPGNAWGVLNAITFYADHVASRTQDQRLTNAWFGKTARQKQQVLDRLLVLTA